MISFSGLSTVLRAYASNDALLPPFLGGIIAKAPRSRIGMKTGQWRQRKYRRQDLNLHALAGTWT
jgi:hypothetical protein